MEGTEKDGRVRRRIVGPILGSAEVVTKTNKQWTPAAHCRPRLSFARALFLSITLTIKAILVTAGMPVAAKAASNASLTQAMPFW